MSRTLVGRTALVSLPSRRGSMRHILVDFARSRRSAKHGKGLEPVALEEALVVSSNPILYRLGRC